MTKKTETFVVGFTTRFVEFLDKLSLHHLLQKKSKSFLKNGFWIDSYVLFFTAASLVAYIASFIVFKISDCTMYVGYSLIAFLAIWRVYEIVIYQLRVLFVDYYRVGRTYRLISYQRSLILAGCNYIETIFWFAALYSIIAHLGWIRISAPAILSILRESIGLMVANSTGSFDLGTSFGFRLWLSWGTVTAHVLIGLFMTIIILARFVSLLPKPGTMADEEVTKD